VCPICINPSLFRTKGICGFLPSQKVGVDVKGQLYGTDSTQFNFKKIYKIIFNRKTAVVLVIIIDITAKPAYIFINTILHLREEV
jgi:hypothetical protein